MSVAGLELRLTQISGSFQTAAKSRRPASLAKAQLQVFRIFLSQMTFLLITMKAPIITLTCLSSWNGSQVSPSLVRRIVRFLDLMLMFGIAIVSQGTPD